MDPVGASGFGARFDIVGEAGSGGMGKVYEAIDRTTGGRVAIKVLTSSGDRERFAREVAILEALEHEAIVKHVGHGDTAAGHPFLAMQWLAGETLSRRLHRGPLTVLEALELGARLAGALAHAHAAGVIHRDLKPSNVYLVDGQVARACLIDFGVAKLEDGGMTATGQMIGTPGYMAPEQVRGERTVDRRVDVFALGCVIYEAIRGEPAFAGGDLMETVSRLLNDPPPPPVAETPLRLGWLLEAMLAKEPEHRVADCTIVRDELLAIAAALRAGDEQALASRAPSIPIPPVDGPTTNDRPTFAMPSHAPPTQVERPSARRARRRLWPWIAITVLAAIGGGIVGAYLVVRRSEDVPPPPVVAADRRAQSKPCNDADRRGCETGCDGGDPGACWLHGRALLATDVDGALVAFERGCKLGGVFGCAEAALLLLADEPDAKDLAVAARHLERGCSDGDTFACLLMGEQARPNGYWPDVARAFQILGNVCDDRHDDEFRGDACKALHELIVAGEGGDGQRRRAARIIENACRHGVAKACPRRAN